MLDLKPWKRQIESHSNELRQEIDNISDKFLNSDLLSSTVVNSDLKNVLKKFTEFLVDIDQLTGLEIDPGNGLRRQIKEAAEFRFTRLQCFFHLLALGNIRGNVDHFFQMTLIIHYGRAGN